MRTSSPLRAARAAVAAGFATQGLVFISLTTRLPDLADRWDLEELEVSGVLLLVVLLAGVGSVLAEWLASARSSAALLRTGLLLLGAGAAGALLAPDFVVFLAAMAVYGVALGMVDATTNMQAVAVEHRYGRPILPSFHGAWTAGGLVGAGLTLALATAPLGWSALLGLVPAAVAVAPFLARDRTVLATPDAGWQVPWRPLLLVGAAMVVFYLVDTASQAWGALYLDEVLDAPSRLVALATLPYLLASLVVRLAGDGLVARYGAVPVLRVGAVVGCAGLVVVVSAPTWWAAVAGFTVVGAGVAVVAPLSYSAAAVLAGGTDAEGTRDRVDAVVARFNQFNYVGALLGAVLTGVVGRDSLRVGFVVPAVLVLALLPLARAFATGRASAQA